MTAIITFTIPYYKGLDYLDRAILSVLSQEDPRWLLVVLDDRGGEDAEHLVGQYKDERIRYIRNETNLGIAENWNKALSIAETDLVTILHADDELEPSYADDVIRLLERHPEAAAGHCRASIINENGLKTWSLPDEVKKLIRPHGQHDVVTKGEAGLISLARGSWIFCPTLCYRREKIPEGGFSGNWSMVLDVVLMSQILMSGGTLVGSPNIAYRYRRHSANQTAKLTNSYVRFQEEIAYLNQVSKECSRIGWKRAARTANRKSIIRLHMMYQAIRSVGQLKLKRAGRLFGAAFTANIE
jgi:glycosyltransferase involved in cell wall biosynthesis